MNKTALLITTKFSFKKVLTKMNAKILNWKSIIQNINDGDTEANNTISVNVDNNNICYVPTCILYAVQKYKSNSA